MAAGDVKLAYAASSNLTVTNLHSVASSSTWLGGWESGLIDNSTNLYTDYRITAKITVASSGLSAGEIRLYLVGMLDDSTWPDVFDGTESTETVTDSEMRDAICRLGAVSQTDTTASDVYYLDCPSAAAVFGGNLPHKFVIFITQSTGNTLAASGNQVTVKGSYANVAQSQAMLIRTAPGISRPNTSRVRPWLPIHRGLVAWYPLHGSDADAVELVNANTATRVGGTATSPTAPHFDRVARFAGGTNEYLTIPAGVGSPIDASAEGTVSAWVRLRVATPATDPVTGPPFSLDGMGSASHYPYTDGVCYLAHLLNSERVSFTPLASVTRTDFHLLTITAKMGTNGWTCYQNAQIAAQFTPGVGISASIHAVIGGNSSSILFDGDLCDLRIWNRCLSSAEVWSMYDPATRWAHYGGVRRRWVDVPAAAAGGGGVTRPYRVAIPQSVKRAAYF